MKFVDVKNDIAFRKLFGNQNKKIILISFLNAVLKRDKKNLIVDVDIQDSYQFPIIKNLRATIVDVKAKDINGNMYFIEMQVSEPAGLDKRLQFYTSKGYAQQIKRGENFKKLKPVIFIGIFDFNFTKTNKYYSHHATCDIETQERVLTDIDYFFIELPKFKKEEIELEEIMDKWIYFIKNVAKLEVIPENVQDPGLLEAYEGAKEFNWNIEELNAYDNVAMREQDDRGKITFAIKKGRKEGEEIGLTKGEEIGLIKGEEIGVEKTLQIFELIKQGKTDEEIIKKLKCSITRIQTIRKSVK